MIADKDRSGYFGASDTRIIMGTWQGKTFEKWWLIKLGISNDSFCNKYTIAGTYYEHAIAEAIEDDIKSPLELDTQFILPEYLLRINLDTNTSDSIYEIKTHKDSEEEWTPPKHYRQQVMVQMWGAEKFYKRPFKGYIVGYPLTEDHYKNFFLKIDRHKLSYNQVVIDNDFIKEYERRLKILHYCLKKGIYPKLNMEVANEIL